MTEKENIILFVTSKLKENVKSFYEDDYKMMAHFFSGEVTIPVPYVITLIEQYEQAKERKKDEESSQPQSADMCVDNDKKKYNDLLNQLIIEKGKVKWLEQEMKQRQKITTCILIMLLLTICVSTLTDLMS